MRLVLAGAFSCLAFWLAVFPVAPRVIGMQSTIVAFRVLNTPPSALNLVLPFWLRSGLATNFNTYAPQTPLPWYRLDVKWGLLYGYLQVAIPAYILFLYGLTAGFHALRRRTLGIERVEIPGA